MPRCKKKRCCRRLGSEKVFKPISVPWKKLKMVDLELDEFEAIRLCDLEDKSQIDAGQAMGVSRGTIQRLLKSARKKIVKAFLEDDAIRIKNDYKKEE